MCGSSEQSLKEPLHRIPARYNIWTMPNERMLADNVLSTVDRWRVVLKGETPDYINATVVHVSDGLI